ncbi:MAG: deoxyribonuclease IV [Candidatus Euphemobacter frigidus]|nr:deoxyribonuclease IV [Candidatus Euphemobacter frigidus]
MCLHSGSLVTDHRLPITDHRSPITILPYSMRIGAHISIAGGVSKAVGRARAAGCEAVQIFSGNPRGWKVKPFDPAEISRFKELCHAEDIRPVIIHSPYLINLSAPDETIYRKSLAAFQDDLKRADLLGADEFIIHVGYHRGEGLSAGIRKMAVSLRETIDNLPELKTRILLENTASAGSSLGHRFEYMSEIMERSGVGGKLYLCFDTCHAYVSGYDIATASGLDNTLTEIDRLIGLERLRVVHFNDAKFGLGSRRDRHEHIGKGKIGMAGMRRIARHPALQDKVFILETPKESPGDDPRNIELLKKFRLKKSRPSD